MATVSRAEASVIIEVPARFKPLQCDRIAALFQDALTLPLLPPDRIAPLLRGEREFGGKAGGPAKFAAVWREAFAEELAFDTDGFVELLPVTTTRALEVRCSMRDCPGQAGWVIERAIADAAIGQITGWPKLLYLMPRGYRLDDGVIVPTARMKEQRRRGYVADRGYTFAETAGRRENQYAFDHLAVPFHPREMPADALDLSAGDDGFLVRCPACKAPRFLRVTAEAATARFPAERCGVYNSCSDAGAS